MIKIKLGKRQICKVNYTRTVSLPKVWLENVGLDVHDIVELFMSEKKSLIIKPSKEENHIE